jgi:hypothetical protein
MYLRALHFLLVLLTWPDLKDKDQQGRTLGRHCKLGSFPTIAFAYAVEA